MIALAFCIFVAPVLAIATRRLILKDEKTLSQILVEYGIFTLLANWFVLAVLSALYEFAFMNLQDLATTPNFIIKYTALSAVFSVMSGYFSCHSSIRAWRENNERPKPSIRRTVWGIVNNIIILVFSSVALLLLTSSVWIRNNFGTVTPDSLFFQVFAPMQGTNEDVLHSFFMRCIAVSVLGTAVAMIFANGPWKSGKRIKVRFFGYTINMFFDYTKRMKRYFAVLSVLALIVGMTGMISQLGARDLHNYFFARSNVIENYYIDPLDVQIKFPEKPRNLIYIYMESMENTYASKEHGGAMEYNLIPELTQLAYENISFSNGELLGGEPGFGGHTTSALVGSLSGLPLKDMGEFGLHGEQGLFLPGVYNLGDMLRDRGYNQTIIFGSDADFGYRAPYFRQHGDFRILDIHTARKEGIIEEDYKVFWGFEDKYLYEYAKMELATLSVSDQPFNLSLLTVDTHAPDGYLCSLCETKGEDGMGYEYEIEFENVVACASRQVYGFIEWLKEQPYYEDTTIIVTGDHLSMGYNYFENVTGIDKTDYERTTYNTFINSVADTHNTTNRQFLIIDMFPTVLAAMGVEIEGDRLAMGTNMFSDRQTLSEELGHAYLFSELNKRSSFYTNRFMFKRKS